MRIGQSTIPPVRMPAVLKGQVIEVNLENLQGQWGIICDLPPFEFAEAVVLNQFHRTVKKEGGMLLGMRSWADPFFDSYLPKAKILGIPLLADPLGRLDGVLGVSKNASSDQCRSFIFDPGGVLRYHFVHRLNWYGLSFLVKVLKDCQDLYPLPVGKFTNRSSSHMKTFAAGVFFARTF